MYLKQIQHLKYSSMAYYILFYLLIILREFLFRGENSLYNNKITDPGAIAIGEALKINKTLHILMLVRVACIKCNNLCSWSEYSLSLNNITDVGAISIAESLCGNTTLTHLSFVSFFFSSNCVFLFDLTILK
jgi:hypothetical protein